LDFFEAVSENFLDTEGRPLEILLRVAERTPIILHGVSLSIGSADALRVDFLRKLKALAARIDARWISDHLCWSSIDGNHLHDLLPLPYDREALRHVASRVRSAQKILGNPLILENPSTYLAFRRSTMTEWEFLARLAEETGCGILLDINNVYVSSVNHSFDPHEYVDAIPKDRVAYLHLAGHTRYATHILDTHSDHVADPVWDLYVRTQRRFGGRATLLEWDEDIPTFEVVARELDAARRRLRRAGMAALGRAHAAR
jgi:uncharacterized protein (UPF0276 family)